MKIRGFEQTNRFYKKDGWTRESITELIKNKSDFVNVLRKIEPRVSSTIITDYITGKTKMVEEPYFTVYCQHVIFDKKKVKQHEYIQYSIDGHKSCTIDKFFEHKNKCE